MIPGTYGLEIYRGDDHAWRFVLWGDEAKTVPVDLAAIVVEAEVRDRPGGAVVAPADIVVTAPNIIDMSLGHAVTRTLPTSGRWDLQLTDAAGMVATVLAGPVRVTGDITESDITAGLERRRGYLTEPAT